MEEGTTKTIVWDSNSEPPKNYIWAIDGKFKEYNGSQWVDSTIIKSTTNIPVTTIVLDKSTASITAGDKTTITATISPSDASDITVTWLTSDDAVATVDDSGEVTAVATGDAVITAAIGGKIATCTVTVA